MTLNIDDDPQRLSMKISPDEQLESGTDDSNEPLTDAESALEEKKLLRRLDGRILPLTCLLYLFACGSLKLPGPFYSLAHHWDIDLDRSNLGNARLQGLPDDVLGGDPTGELFSWINSVFFFSYVRFTLGRSNICSE